MKPISSGDGECSNIAVIQENVREPSASYTVMWIPEQEVGLDVPTPLFYDSRHGPAV